MSYIEGRTAHDADSHVMEPPHWYDEWLEPGVLDRLEQLIGPRDPKLVRWAEKVDAKQDDADYRSRDAEEVMLRKGMEAAGSYRREDRSAVLDHLGFASQLVFTTSLLGPLVRTDRSGDVDLAHGLARGHNRAIVDFCALDPRLLPVGALPMGDVERAGDFAGEALAGGVAALMVASWCPKGHSPSHVGFDRVWAQLQEAGVPLVFHVGGGQPMDASYKENGLPPVKDFIGGDANFTSVSFLPIASAPMQTLGTMILDGVLDRFPALKIGVIEQGASWVPSWMRQLDAAAEAFHRSEERLQRLSMRPSDFVRRQIKATPFPYEKVGWIMKNAGPSICLFNSDYPHTEGGRNPVKRFEASLDEEGCTEAEKQAFYCDNFVELMGSAMDRVTVPVG